MGFFSRKPNSKTSEVKAPALADAFPSLVLTQPAASRQAPATSTVSTAAAEESHIASTAAVQSKAVAPTVPLAPEVLAKHKARAKQVSAAFGQIVSLMMRDPKRRDLTLADLEWMVVPPLLAGQFSIAEAQSKARGISAPVAAVL